MKVHANAALGPAGRLALVKAIESGMTQKAAAAAFCVAPATAHRWWHRRLDAGADVADDAARANGQPAHHAEMLDHAVTSDVVGRRDDHASPPVLFASPRCRKEAKELITR